MEDRSRKQGSQSSNASSSRDSNSRSGAMSPQEAGHLGGIAPHECRGFECQQRGSSRSDSSRSSRDEE